MRCKRQEHHTEKKKSSVVKKASLALRKQHAFPTILLGNMKLAYKQIIGTEWSHSA